MNANKSIKIELQVSGCMSNSLDAGKIGALVSDALNSHPSEQIRCLQFQGWAWFKMSRKLDSGVYVDQVVAAEEKQRTTTKIEGHDQSHKPSLHVVVPGLGASSRMKGLKKSITNLALSTKRGGYGFSCAVYVWNDKLMHEAIESLKPCQVLYNEGLWTNHMLQVDEEALGDTTHVAVLIDDVDVSNIDGASFLQNMALAKYDAASAAVPGWHYDVLHPRPQCKFHRTDFADVLFKVFTMQAWKCWKEQINVELNDNGWGYDALFSEKCGTNIGVIDNAIARHEGACDNGGDCTRSYDSSTAMRQLWDWIVHETGARDQDEAKAYLKHVTRERPERFPTCDDPVLSIDLQKSTKFLLADGRYFSTAEHRGGWKSVIQYLMEETKTVEILPGLADIADDHKRLKLQRSGAWNTLTKSNRGVSEKQEKLLLLDITENWFLSKGGAVDVPWIGITHLASKPPRFASLGIEKILKDPDFIQSLPNCRGIVVLASHMKDEVRKVLSKKIGDNVKDMNICSAYHPIAVGKDAVQYNPKIDLNATFEEGHGVVLLGQQYRRYANFHRLKINGRPKFWLPGSERGGERAGAKHRAEKELTAEGVEEDKSIEMIYTKTFQEYDQMVKQNIVIIDLHSATANNAVLEAMALNAPFLVRSLPGTREYLGEDYPLFFDGFDSLQAMLKDEIKLKKLLLKAHLYLKEMDKSRFSLENFSKTLDECVSRHQSTYRINPSSVLKLK